MSKTGNEIDSIDDLDPTDTVHIAPATKGRAARRVVHLSTDCEYCFENANKHEVRSMPNVDGLCDYCTGDPRTVGEDESREADWSTQQELRGAAERAAEEGVDPLEALSAEKRARAGEAEAVEGADAE